MQFENDRFYRVKDIAEAFDVSVNTIYRAIDAGELQAVKFGVGKGAIRVSGESLNTYLTTGEKAVKQEVSGEVSA